MHEGTMKSWREQVKRWVGDLPFYNLTVQRGKNLEWQTNGLEYRSIKLYLGPERCNKREYHIENCLQKKFWSSGYKIVDKQKVRIKIRNIIAQLPRPDEFENHYVVTQRGSDKSIKYDNLERLEKSYGLQDYEWPGTFDEVTILRAEEKPLTIYNRLKWPN